MASRVGGYTDFIKVNAWPITGAFILGAVHGIMVGILLFVRMPKHHWVFALLGFIPIAMQLKINCQSYIFASMLAFLHLLCWITQWEDVRVEVLDGIIE